MTVPGKAVQRGGHGAFFPPNNSKQIEAERFAHQLASGLDDQRQQNCCNQIMLVADPSFLGLLNKSLNNQTAQLVFKSLNKDYSKVVPRDLLEMLGLIAPKKDSLS